MQKYLLAILFIVSSYMTAVAQVELIKDIFPGEENGIPYFDNQIIVYQDQLYFSASDSTHGIELWTSDGTEAGTQLVKDIYPGAQDSDCQNFYVANGYLLFTANSELGSELWRSDGTTDGTVLVKDIRTGGGDGAPSDYVDPLDRFFVWNEVLYFTGDDGNGGGELWRSNGTEAGTYMIKNIRGFGSSWPEEYGVYNGKLYFSADDGNGSELWVTDGTESGTQLVAAIGSTLAFGSSPSDLVSCNGYLLFIAKADFGDDELWRSDGTVAGTEMVKNINPTTGGLQTQPNTFEHRLIKIGNTIYFSADDGVNGRELWKSDGTEQGTVLVKDATPGSEGYTPQVFTVAKDILYYKYDDGVHGHELWRSDGTEAGTFMVKDIDEGSSGSMAFSIHLAAIDNQLFFRAADSGLNQELWQSDGTEAGTVLAAEINPGGWESLPRLFTEYQDYVVFAAMNNDTGQELWKFPLPQPAPLEGQLLISQIIACNGGRGALLVNVSGGEPPLTYTWNDAALQGASPDNLPAGDYAVTVTDSDGMTIAFATSLTEPPLLMASVSSTPASGSAADGTASVSAIGGTPPYVFNWDVAGSPNTPFLNNLTAGTYEVTVSDANDCTVKRSVEVEMTSATNLILETRIQLVPNPAKNYFAIQFSTSLEVGEVQVFDAYGRMVRSWLKVTSGLPLLMEQLRGGVYVVVVQLGDQQVVKKLIVE